MKKLLVIALFTLIGCGEPEPEVIETETIFNTTKLDSSIDVYDNSVVISTEYMAALAIITSTEGSDDKIESAKENYISTTTINLLPSTLGGATISSLNELIDANFSLSYGSCRLVVGDYYISQSFDISATPEEIILLNRNYDTRPNKVEDVKYISYSYKFLDSDDLYAKDRYQITFNFELTDGNDEIFSYSQNVELWVRQ